MSFENDEDLVHEDDCHSSEHHLLLEELQMGSGEGECVGSLIFGDT